MIIYLDKLPNNLPYVLTHIPTAGRTIILGDPHVIIIMYKNHIIRMYHNKIQTTNTTKVLEVLLKGGE